MLRVIALSLALLVGIGTVIPLATHYAEAGQRPKKHKKKREWKGVKKYSKRWWQLYRRQEKRKKAHAQAARALRLRQIRLANSRKALENGDSEQGGSVARSNRRTVTADTSRAVLPSGEAAPQNWKRGQVSGSELQYKVEGGNGYQVGSASIAVVGPAIGGPGDSLKSKTVGGVSTSSLRRTVIDKMVGEEGWVINDYQKEIGGKNVYVVVAKSPGAGNIVLSRLFYFTEVDGKIYSVATNAPADNSAKLEQESEKVVNSLQHRTGTQQADLR